MYVNCFNEKGWAQLPICLVTFMRFVQLKKKLNLLIIIENDTNYCLVLTKPLS